MDTTKIITKIKYGNTELPLKTLNLQSKTVTPTRNAQHILPDIEYAGLSDVHVEAIPEDYVQPSGELLITENNQSYDVKNYESARVEVPIPEDYINPQGEVVFRANGNYNVREFNTAKIEVPIPAPVLQEKTAKENGEVTPDEGFDGLSKVIVEVESSGGETEKGEFCVQVFDYDGTLLDEKWLNNGEVYTISVTPPTHDRLVFQEWSCTQEIVDGQITIDNNDVMIGTVYTTATGLNEFDYEVTRYTGKSIILNLDGTKDWGDGTSDDLTTHEYADYGKYTVVCSGSTFSENIAGDYATTSMNALKRIRLGNVNANSFVSKVFMYANKLETITFPQSADKISLKGYCFYGEMALKCVIFPLNYTFSDYSFYSNKTTKTVLIPHGTTIIPLGIGYQTNNALKNAVIPKTVFRVDRDSYQKTSCIERLVFPKPSNGTLEQKCSNAYSLKKLIVAEGTTSISGFDNLYNLTDMKLPNSLTTVTATFTHCYNLEEFIFPENITNFKTNIFSNSYSLKKVKMPKSLTSFAGGFQYCCALEIIDFSDCLSVPALTSSSFATKVYDFKIVVPDALYDEWIVATNWASFADQIYKASEVEL